MRGIHSGAWRNAFIRRKRLAMERFSSNVTACNPDCSCMKETSSQVIYCQFEKKFRRAFSQNNSGRTLTYFSHFWPKLNYNI